MTRREKLIARIRARPPEAEFRDVERLLWEFGWQRRGQRGSHVTFAKPGEDYPLIVVIHGGHKVGRIYLDRVCRRLGLDD